MEEAVNVKNDNMILCVSNSYEKKYYLNEAFAKLPKEVKDELKIMCVLFTEEVGGILSLEFDKDGNLYLKPEADEADILYDEISCGLLINRIIRDKEELMQSLEMFYKVFFIEQGKL